MPNDVVIADEPQEVNTLDFLNKSIEEPTEVAPIVEEEAEAEAEEQPDNLILEEKPAIDDDEFKFVTPFKKSEVLKAYPDIFKKFPDMEQKIYKGQAYEEVFPTVKEAKESKEHLEVLERAEAALFSGDLTDILKSVKNEDDEAFKRIVEGFLPTINNLDRTSYVHVIGNVGKYFIENIVGEANRFPKDSDQQRQLMLSAATLNQYLFGTTQYTPPTKLAKEVTDGDKKLKAREQELLSQRFSEIQSDLVERTQNQIKATINKYIDPKESMSMYVRSKAIDDCMKLLDQNIGSDEAFKAKLDRSWANVIESNFAKASQEQVRTAYLGRVQSVLLDIIKKVRADAMSGMNGSPRKKLDEEEEDQPVKKSLGKSSPTNRGHDDGPRRGESTAAYLNRTLGS